MEPIKAGSTNQTIYFRLRDATSGLAKVGLAWNSAGASCYYVRNRGLATAITLATLAAADSAHTDGGFKEVHGTNMKGLYRLDLPDAVVVSGSRGVEVSIEFDGVIEETKEISLTGQADGLPTVDTNNRIVGIQGTKNNLDALTDITAAQVNNELDGALNTAIPGSPTADSLNQRIKALDDLLQSGGTGDAAAMKAKLDTLHDTRLTSARAGYLAKLNITGNVAASGEVTAIQNNTRVRVIIPGTLERPDSGSTLYQLDLYIYDTDGNMEAPDSLPTITAQNEAGTSRSSNLGTVTLVATGVYKVTYTVASSHLIEQIRFEWSIVEGGVTKKHGAASQIVDTTAVDFTAADRTKLDTLHDTRCTEVRMAELDAANLPADVDTLKYAGPRGPGVYLDDAAANTNTVVGVDGIGSNPVSTIAAATTIAGSLGIQRIYLINDAVITLAQTYEGWEFVGIGLGNQITLGSQDVDNSSFFFMTLTGTQGGTGMLWCQDCGLTGLLALECLAYFCYLTGNNTLRASTLIIFDHCSSAVPGNATPELTFSGGATAVNFRHGSCGLQINAMGAGDVMTYEVVGGQIIVDATCTDGLLTVRGDCDVTDNSGGAVTITQSAAINQANINAAADTAISDAALATGANLATVDTVVDAIKAVTDLLPNGGALSDLATLVTRLTDARAAVLDDLINAGRLDVILDAINTATGGLAGAAMRGTDAVDTSPMRGTDSAGTAANLATVDTVVDAIKAVTDLLPNAGALSDLATLVSRLTAARATAMDELLAANLPADVDTLLTRVPGVVLIRSETMAELPVGVPPVNPTFEECQMAFYMALRNRMVLDTSGAPDHKFIRNSAGAVIFKKVITDSGGVYDEAKAITGP
jgi:hypothetical protein